MKFNLVRTWDDHESTVLGVVKDPTSRPIAVSHGLISQAWERFKDSKPDCDTEFVEYLCSTYGFVENVAHYTNVMLE